MVSVTVFCDIRAREATIFRANSGNSALRCDIAIVLVKSQNYSRRLKVELYRTIQDRCRIVPKWSPFHGTTSMFITAIAHSPVLPHTEANTDAAFVLLIPHHTPRNSQSATHRELHPRALLPSSSS